MELTEAEKRHYAQAKRIKKEQILLIPVDNSDYQAEQALKNVLSILCEHQFFEVKFKHKVHGNDRPRSENN